MRIAVSTTVLMAGLALIACQAGGDPIAARAPATGAQAIGGDPRNPVRAMAPLTITTARGKRIGFRVEVARSNEEQMLGLMFRTALAPRTGMIFPMDPPRPASFWMRNTLIPLDMIFVRADGTIALIAENTVPLSLDPVESGEPVAAVFEIAGGQARAQGIAAGDRIRWGG
ncbi:DUF192 domain-containing protein [Sphingomonas sp. 1P06PA]|uniref:DUF192 domain-containing protein n=1 Tax=Sphingomonas sp. 1P06PA TaxID=554121 RepID=UPI0039A457F1